MWAKFLMGQDSGFEFVAYVGKLLCNVRSYFAKGEKKLFHWLYPKSPMPISPTTRRSYDSFFNLCRYLKNRN